MRRLEQDTRPVTGVVFAAARTAMVQVDQNLKRLAHNPMGFRAFDVDQEPDTTGIVLKLGIVQALFRRQPRGCRASKPLPIDAHRHSSVQRI